jgi:ubiquinone/menaquinone biosynthesis C-methylase UbiE
MKTCKICGKTSEAKSYFAKEMMYLNAGRFEYFECPHCKCLQIDSVPENLSEYYGPNYYSYNKPADTVTRAKTQHNKRILDVGCGAGALLCSMAATSGIESLTGCDPFIEKDISYENGVQIFKKTVHEMTGEFDIIMLNDSFEHMTDPHETMDSLKRLLASGGTIKMTLPIYPNIAFDKYKENWYQLDAPRHIFLHSINSLKLLADQHGFKIAQMIFDSNNSAILRSYLYTKGITFWKQDPKEIFKYFTKSEIIDIDKKMAEANKKGYGDHATVFFMHK